MINTSQDSGSIFRIHRTGEGKLIEKMSLENGLTLEMFDYSRHVAGDRWIVFFEARIEVQVKREYFEGQYKPNLPFDDIRSAVGPKVFYRHEKVRNFIAEAKKDEVFKGLKERFMSTSLSYLSSPEFPGRLILRKYRDAVSPALVWKKQ